MWSMNSWLWCTFLFDSSKWQISLNFFLKKLCLSDVMYSTIDHWILSFEVSKPSWILEAASPLLVLIKPNFPFFLCSTISKHFIFMHTLLISQPLHLFPRVNKFAIVQAIQIIASPLCSSDALLTSNPKEPCPRHHGNQSRMHLGPFVLSHLIKNCMYLAIDMRLYQILAPICILADLACLAASSVGGVRHRQNVGTLHAQTCWLSAAVQAMPSRKVTVRLQCRNHSFMVGQCFGQLVAPGGSLFRACASIIHRVFCASFAIWDVISRCLLQLSWI